MQPIDLAAIKAAKATDRKTLAILAYDNATADPAGANWRSVADILRLAIPATKAKAAEIEADSPFAPWADYLIPPKMKLGKSPVIVVALADGEVVRAPAVSIKGKPVNIGRGLRVAFAFYRARIAARAGEMSECSDCVMVPELVSIICETMATEYDAADCNARTAATRAGSFDGAKVAADSLAYPVKTDDGGLDRLKFIKASYRMAVARLRLSRPDAPEDTSDLDYLIENCTLRLAGWSMLQIKAKRRADDEAARKPAPVAPAFKVPSRFLSSSHLTLVHSAVPVAPSCAIRVA